MCVCEKIVDVLCIWCISVSCVLACERWLIRLQLPKESDCSQNFHCCYTLIALWRIQVQTHQKGHGKIRLQAHGDRWPPTSIIHTHMGITWCQLLTALRHTDSPVWRSLTALTRTLVYHGDHWPPCGTQTHLYGDRWPLSHTHWAIS